MTKTVEDYNDLAQYGKEIKTLSSLNHLLSWDQETKMPKGGIEFRSDQQQMLSGLVHERQTSEKFRKLLEKLICIESGEIKNKQDLDDEQISALREWHKDYIKAKKLPDSFVKEFAKVTSTAVQAWSNAKKDNDFDAFAPHLEKILKLCRKKTEYLGYTDHPYDALLDEFEPSMTTKKLDPIFKELKPFLIDLAKKASKKSIETDFLYGDFDKAKLMSFSEELLKQMGLDRDHYRLDLSEHPFCLPLHPTDLRITTHSSCTDLVAGNISAVIHEGGHALYEMGLPKEHFGTPLCEHLSMAIHESQSKFWETMIGQSHEFWEYFFPLLQKKFPENLKEVTVDSLYKAINKVTPSFIRVHADEITYGLHVILRYELEKDLISGKLNVSDVPNAWNAKMEEYLGIKPKDFSEGCLQDIHWAWGLFGYFPTYLLGNLYAGQLYKSFKAEHPDYAVKISQGQLTFIRDWLKEHVHKHGRALSQEELITKATGEPLSPKAFEEYLKSKYL